MLTTSFCVVYFQEWEVGPPLQVARQEVASVTMLDRVYVFGWDNSCESIGDGDAEWREEAPCPLVLGGADGMAGQFAATAIGSVAYFAGEFGLLSFAAATGE